MSTQSEGLTGPVVFFCSKCRVILGDSFSLVFASEASKTLTLGMAVEVTLGSTPVSSKSGQDVGATYRVATCKQCASPLGKSYIATPHHLDSSRGCITFDIDRVSSYVLGTQGTVGRLEGTASGVPASQGLTQQQQQQQQQQHQQQGAGDTSDLARQLEWTQELVMGLEMRMAVVEGRLGIDPQEAERRLPSEQKDEKEEKSSKKRSLPDNSAKKSPKKKR